MKKIKESWQNLKVFLEEVNLELKKCTWPTRQELMGSTVVVIISLIVTGAYVGLCDSVLINIFRWIIR